MFWVLHNNILEYDHNISKKNGKIVNTRTINVKEWGEQLKQEIDDVVELFKPLFELNIIITKNN